MTADDRLTEDDLYMTRERVEQEQRGEFLPATDDVQVFWQVLHSTKEYQSIVDERLRRARDRFDEIFEDGSEKEPPSREEVANAFGETEEFKHLFWDFYENCLHLSYNPKKMSPEFNSAFLEYREKVKDCLLEVERGKDAEKMREKDLIRSEAHNRVAEVLVKEGLAPSEFKGRMIVRAFLVDVRDDYLPSARSADLLRKARAAPDRTALVKLLMGSSLSGSVNSTFLPGRIKEIQEEFIERYKIFCTGEAIRQVYRERPVIREGGFDSSLPPQGDQENTRLPPIRDVRRNR